jgi:hypothetical protein
MRASRLVDASRSESMYAWADGRFSGRIRASAVVMLSGVFVSRA